jgi:hypothetical protein
MAMQARRVRQDRRVRLVLPASKVRLANRARWVLRMPRQVHRVLPAQPDRRDQRVRRGRMAERARLATLAQQARLVRLAPRATKVRRAFRDPMEFRVPRAAANPEAKDRKARKATPARKVHRESKVLTRRCPVRPARRV